MDEKARKIHALKGMISWKLAVDDTECFKKILGAESLALKTKLWVLDRISKAARDKDHKDKEEYYNIFLESTTLSQAKQYLSNKVIEYFFVLPLWAHENIFDLVVNIEKSPDISSLLKTYHVINNIYNFYLHNNINDHIKYNFNIMNEPYYSMDEVWVDEIYNLGTLIS